jgi:hypothetical protein
MQLGAKLVATPDVGTVLVWKGAADGAPGWIKVADAHGKKGTGGERWVQLTTATAAPGGGGAAVPQLEQVPMDGCVVLIKSFGVKQTLTVNQLGI